MSKKKLAIIISSAAAAVIVIILAIVLPLTLIKKDKPSDSEPPQGITQPDPTQPGASQPAQTFINHVKSINTPITLDSEAAIEAGYIIYDFMHDSDKEADAVIENKVLLDGYKLELGVLQAEKEEQDRLAMQATLRERFATAVGNLPDLEELTSDNREDIDALYALYEQLDEQSRAYAFVKSALQDLKEAEDMVAEIELEEHLAEVAETATEFIEGVNALYLTDDGEEKEITLESKNSLEDLLYDYENFSDEIKEYDGVEEAKQKLDKAFEEYKELKDKDDIEKFIAYAEQLSGTVTLESEKALSNAEYLYNREMSENAKAAEGVSAAYEIVIAAREEYDKLFQIRETERIEAFIKAANAVGTNLKDVDITWFEVLEAAGDAYGILTYESQKLPEVEEAFDRWNSAQMAFDKKGYKQLPMKDPNIQIAGDGNIVLGNEFDNKAITKTLFDYYGVSSKAELDEVAILWLHVYTDDGYQGKVAIRFTDIGDNPGHLILAPIVTDALKRLSAENGNVKSGASYSFALSYEDKDGTQIIHSPVSKVSKEKVAYSW